MRSALLVPAVALALSACAATPPPARLPTTALAVPAGTDPQGQPILPAGTEIPLVFDVEFTSSKAKIGDPVKMSVGRDVTVGGVLVIPRGTPANAAVSYRSGRGAFGKAAKMDIEAHAINLPAHQIAVTGKIHSAGRGNGAAVVGSALLLGPLAGGISGENARFRKGTILTVRTVDPVPAVPAG